MVAQTTNTTNTAPSSDGEIKITRELDCRGELCPMPIYKTAMALGQLKDGDVLEILCTDPGSLKDFPALARQAGHTLLLAQQRDEHQIFWMKKGGA